VAVAPTQDAAQSDILSNDLDSAKPSVAPKSASVARKDGRTLRRMTIYLPQEIANRLRVYCAERDLDVSSVVTDAVQRVLGG